MLAYPLLAMRHPTAPHISEDGVEQVIPVLFSSHPCALTSVDITVYPSAPVQEVDSVPREVKRPPGSPTHGRRFPKPPNPLRFGKHPRSGGSYTTYKYARQKVAWHGAGKR